MLSVVGLFLFVKVVTSIANGMSRAAQPQILKNDLGCDEAMLGMFMSAQFGFGGFANTFLLAPVTKMLGGKVSIVVRNCVIIMASSYFLLAVLYGTNFLPAGNARQFPFIGITMLLAVFQYSLGTSITANTTGLVPTNYQGTLMGIEHSLFAIAYVIAPKVGVKAFQVGGISGLGVACGSVFSIALIVWLIFYKDISVAPNKKSSAKKSE